MPAITTTPLDVATSVDPNLFRDVFLQDDIAFNFGRLNGEADQSFGRIFRDSANSAFRIEATRDGAGAFEPITFFTGGSEQARLTEDGIFLVGTDTASIQTIAEFHTDADQFERIIVKNSNSGSAARGLVVVENDAGRTGSLQYTSSTFTDGTFGADELTLNAGTGSSALNIFMSASGPIQWFTGGVRKMILNASGELLINAASQVGTSKLHVGGDITGTAQMTLFGGLINTTTIFQVASGESSATLSRGVIASLTYTGTPSQTPIGGTFIASYAPAVGPTVPAFVTGIDAQGITAQREGAAIADVIGARFRWGVIINTVAPVRTQGILVAVPQLLVDVPPTGDTIGIRIEDQGDAATSIAYGILIETQSSSTDLVGIDINANNMQFDEMSDPLAPAANRGRIYMRDSGGGKTEFVVRFNTGAVQVIAVEP